MRTQPLLSRLLLVIFIVSLRSVHAGNFYAGISPATVPWPGGIVPYEFATNLTPAEQQTYLDGLREWELAANVKFVPYTNQANWILFSYNTNFLDYVSGGGYSPQMVTVSSLSRAQVCHEMGHSFGFTHENIRPDATNYILVLTNNIINESSNIYWFTIDPTSVTNGKYDYESVMHLGWDFDSTKPATATQQPKPPNFPRYQYRMGNYCLSPGDRAALAYLYPPATQLSNVVTNTADAGLGSLRAALYYVTDHPSSVVTFNIPTSDPGYSNGVFNIHLTGMLPPLVSNAMVIDGSTQPGYAGKPLIMVDGSRILPETYPSYASDTGLLVYSSSNQVKALSFSGFQWNGLTFEYNDSSNNTVAGCWLGIDQTGTNPAPNANQGVLIQSGASHNLIGGSNVISGNSQYGVFITDSNTTGNIVEGNYIGTDASGSNAVPNVASGMIIQGWAADNTISNNVISGNITYGIFLTNTSGNIFSGNYIGVNASGETMLSNTFDGIGFFANVESNFFGPRNVISGNTTYGMEISGTNSDNNYIFGNLIGTDAKGTNAIPNGDWGIGIFNDANGNIVGGTSPVMRNIISGNTGYGYGIAIGTANSNIVEGNYIGTDINGKTAIPNTFAGVAVEAGSTGNIIGGTNSGTGNLVSGNGEYGIDLDDANRNFIQGNDVGTNISEQVAIPNGFAGVVIDDGSTSNVVGGLTAGAGNLIAFNNNGPGVAVYQSNTTNNSIRGNSIFDNSSGIDLDGFPGDHVGYEAGPNDWQNYPIITNAFGYSGSTIIEGNFNSLPNDTYYLDFYYNNNYSDFFSQGQVYLGAVSVVTDGSGNAFFAYTNTGGNYSGQYVSATATAATGDTSEFSSEVQATNAPAPSAQFTGPFHWLSDGFVFNLTFTTNFSYHIQAATNLATNPVAWITLTNFTATNVLLIYTDRTATGYRARFYRVTSP